MFAPRPRVSHAVTVKKRSNKDIEAAIAAAFSQMAIQLSRQNSWRPQEESKFLHFLVSSILLWQSWHGLQGYRAFAVAL